VRARYPSKPVYRVPNGVDVQRFREADGRAFREVHGFEAREKIVLCVSRIDPQKNQLGLVRAFAQFSGSHPDHRLVLVGPVAVPAYHAELVAGVDRLGLRGKVRLMGGLRPDDPLLPSAYKAAEFFVLPSVHEPFGIVVLEAWAAGVPVLASRVGGIPDFAVDRRTALLAEPGSGQELLAGMEELAERASLRAALAEQASRVVEEEYDWSVVAGRLLEIYREQVGRH
jgi:glycosyltransferase involved in cell wall biosynthesis